MYHRDYVIRECVSKVKDWISLKRGYGFDSSGNWCVGLHVLVFSPHAFIKTTTKLNDQDDKQDETSLVWNIIYDSLKKVRTRNLAEIK